jgi:hypothetical protein
MSAMISSTFSGRPMSTSAAAASARSWAGAFALRKAISILSGPFCVFFHASIFSELTLSHAPSASTKSPNVAMGLMGTGC